MAYTQRYGGGFVDLPSQTTAVDSAFLNAVEDALLTLYDADPSADGQVLQWIDASSKYGPALLLNKNVSPSAAISWSKIATTGAVVNADVAGGAAIAKSKLDFGSGLVNADIAAAAAIAATKIIPARVSDTVSGLGTATDGAIGLIRAGTTPYSFMPVFYDGTYAKWVSAPIPVFHGYGASTTTTGSYVDLTDEAILDWRGYSVAGLLPQFRGRTYAGSNGATAVTMTLALALAGADALATLSAYGTEFGDTTASYSSAVSKIIDTGWIAPTLPTLADYISVKPRGKASNNTNAKTWVDTAVWLRWTS